MRKTTVLVVDDSATVRAAMGALLKARGYEAILASDAEAGMQLAAECAPDVILLDIVMPGTDGLAMLARLKVDVALAHIPVVFLSQKTSLRDIVRGLSLGGHDYLTKPAQPEEVIARVAAAARVKSVVDQLRARNDDLEAFSLRASHDLKSPLTVIRQAAHLLGQGQLEDGAQARMLEMIESSVLRADRLINDLLALARSAAHEHVVTNVQTEQTVREVVEETALKNAEVLIEGTWTPVSVSEADFISIITNLVENASHYGRDGSGKLKIAIHGRVAGSNQEITIADEGDGVAPADQAQVFEPFYRAADSQRRNPLSSGVGLALVRRAVERNGGAIVLSSGQERGARFTLRLPVADPTGAESSSPTEEKA